MRELFLSLGEIFVIRWSLYNKSNFNNFFILFSAGCRITQIHLLCGGIIPLLSALEMAMAKHADKIGLT